jgi:hypothetical protein
MLITKHVVRHIVAFTVCVSLLYIANEFAWHRFYNNTQQHVDNYFSKQNEDNPFLTIAILTAPRPDHAIHLLTTINSLVEKYRAYAFTEDKPKVSCVTLTITKQTVVVLVMNHFVKENRIFQAMKSAFKANIEEEQQNIFRGIVLDLKKKNINLRIRVVEKDQPLDRVETVRNNI